VLFLELELPDSFRAVRFGASLAVGVDAALGEVVGAAAGGD
jgi:hypothetical protein